MLLLKNVYNAKLKNTEDKIPDIANLATNTSLNTKINEVQGEITSITNLATAIALTALQIKYLMLIIQLKKTDYNRKTCEIEKKISDYDHDKYITTPEFNKLTAENVPARFTQAKLASKK